jgi:hypothetical protein
MADIEKLGDIGGQPVKTYWTPDGRVIRCIPDIHAWASYKVVNGKRMVDKSGERDANLDKGWLVQMPDAANLKPYCPHCDRWHGTTEEIEECGEKKAAIVKIAEDKAKKELLTAEDPRIAKLEGDMAELKGMFSKIMEKLSG